MQRLWNKLADNFFSKIKVGTLEVIYTDGNKKLYGQKKEDEKNRPSIETAFYFCVIKLYFFRITPF